MVATIKQLQEVAADVIRELRAAPAELVVKTLLVQGCRNVRGFDRVKIPDGRFLTNILRPHRLASNDVKVEIVRVNHDLSKQILYQGVINTVCVVMGIRDRLTNPYRAMVYLEGDWMELDAGSQILIPARTKYGFTVTTGILYFLSVQSPPNEN